MLTKIRIFRPFEHLLGSIGNQDVFLQCQRAVIPNKDSVENGIKEPEKIKNFSIDLFYAQVAEKN